LVVEVEHNNVIPQLAIYWHHIVDGEHERSVLSRYIR